MKLIKYNKLFVIVNNKIAMSIGSLKSFDNFFFLNTNSTDNFFKIGFFKHFELQSQ